MPAERLFAPSRAPRRVDPRHHGRGRLDVRARQLPLRQQSTACWSVFEPAEELNTERLRFRRGDRRRPPQGPTLEENH